MDLNAKRVKKFDERFKQSGGLKINGIRIKPGANIALFEIENLKNWSRTDIINVAIIRLLNDLKTGINETEIMKIYDSLKK